MRDLPSCSCHCTLDVRHFEVEHTAQEDGDALHQFLDEPFLSFSRNSRSLYEGAARDVTVGRTTITGHTCAPVSSDVGAALPTTCRPTRPFTEPEEPVTFHDCGARDLQTFFSSSKLGHYLSPTRFTTRKAHGAQHNHREVCKQSIQAPSQDQPTSSTHTETMRLAVQRDLPNIILSHYIN